MARADHPTKQFWLYYAKPVKALKNFFWQRAQLIEFLNRKKSALPLNSARWTPHFNYALYASLLIGAAAWPLKNGLQYLLPSKPEDLPIPASSPADRVTYIESLKHIVEISEIFIFPATVLIAGMFFGLINRRTKFSNFSASEAYFYFASSRLFWPSFFLTATLSFPQPPRIENALDALLDNTRAISWLFSYTWLVVAITRLSGALSTMSESIETNRKRTPLKIALSYLLAQFAAVFVAILTMLFIGYCWHLIRSYVANHLASLNDPETQIHHTLHFALQLVT